MKAINAVNRIKTIISDYDRKTLYFSVGSLLITVVFALYNGFLGAAHSSLWYGSICIYYIILSLIRAIILSFERKTSKDGNNAERQRRKIFITSHGLLLLMNISLIVPISLMVKLQKPVYMTMVPSIAMAAYTTCKVTNASINMRKKAKTENLLIKELRTINFIDALLSIIVLQNTLIVVNSSGESRRMSVVSAIISAILLAQIIGISVFSFASGVKKLRKEAYENTIDT